MYSRVTTVNNIVFHTSNLLTESNKKKGNCEVMGMLISLIVVIISQCILSKRHIAP